METITTSKQTIYGDRAVTASWSWPSIGAYQHIQVNGAAWHWTASRYAVPYYDSGHGSMIPTNGGNGHNREGVTTANLGVTTSQQSITAYFDMYNSDAGSADVWFVIDYTIINDVPPSTLSASAVQVGQTSTVTLANTAGLSQVKHRTTWSIGSFSAYVDTAAGVDTVSFTIPSTWQSAFTGTAGSLKIEVTTYLNSNSSKIGSRSTYVDLVRDVAYDVPASTITTGNVTAGQASTVTFTNSMLANAKHTVTWSLGSLSHTETTTLGAASVSWTIPTSWCSEFPNANSASVTITVQTLNTYDEARGDPVVRTIFLSVPSYTLQISATATGVNQSYGLYVQGRSQATIAITSSGQYGSTITYSISGPGLNASTASGTSEILTGTGSQRYVCTVTDSRGYTATTTVTIQVEPYAEPVISSGRAYRCKQNTFDEDPAGTRAAYYLDYTFSSLQGNNSVTTSVQLLLGSTVITTISPAAKAQAALLYGTLDARRSYTAVLTISDALGNSDSVEILISTAEVFLYFSRTLNSIGFGKYPEHSDSLELAAGYHIYIGNDELTP